jgi:hypothetical protein
MSDHISGPRALADPIADITDVYAFPSPERPGHLVLVMNTLPFAEPTDAFSDGLIYRFRVRPLVSSTTTDAVPFVVGVPELVFDCVFSAPVRADAGQRVEQDVACTTPTGETVTARVNEEDGSGAGLRVFAGPRWDPFSLVIEVDAALLGDVSIVGVVAETLTRGTFNVRIERVGRPEVKNMMLAMKQFDPVNRDLEIRDLYNMEDGFHLGEAYRGAYRARLNANLAFWDGLDGKTDWFPDVNGDHPLTSLVLADFLVVDLTKPYAERGSFLEIELARRSGRDHRTCGGRTLNDDVRDRSSGTASMRRPDRRHALSRT